MSNSTKALPAQPPAALPPRLFWRRLFAFLADYSLASALAFLLLAALPLPDWVHPGGLPFAPVTTACSTTPTPEPAIAAQRVAGTVLCTSHSFGAPPVRTVIITFDAVRTANTTSRKTVSFTVDRQTRFQPTLRPQQMLSLVLLALVSGLLHRKGRASPGKWLSGLRVSGAPGLRREALRLAPLLLLSLLSLPATLVPPETMIALMDHPPQTLFAIISSLSLASLALVWLWYGFFPLRWTGALRHDRLCATAVLRTRKA